MRYSSFLIGASLLATQCSAYQTQSPLSDESETSSGETAKNPFNEEFQKLAEKQLDYWKVPGMAVGIVHGDHEWSAGYGYSTLPSTKASPSDLWMVGSTSKAFTAAGMSLLINNSSFLSWSTPISSLIRDDFVLTDEYATMHVTIEDALSHRTGMPRHDMAYGSSDGTLDFSAKNLVRSLRHLPLSRELRTQYQYCNMMYVTIAHVIETLTSKTLGSFLQEHLLHPLGMNSTYLSAPEAEAAPEHLATGYYHSDTGFYPTPMFNLSQVVGAGSIASNVHDYQKWIKSWLNKIGPLAKNNQHAQLWAPRTIADTGRPPFTGANLYALGWEVSYYRGHQIFQHGGGMEAFGTNLIIIPSLNYGTIAFGNTGLTSNSAEEALQWHLIDDLLNVPTSERYNWTAHFTESSRTTQELYSNATARFYPSLPRPTHDASIPLIAFEGTYNNGGYGNMTIFMNATRGALQINRFDATWKVELELEHVSGDFFIASLDSVAAPGHIFKERFPAEFVVGADGRPEKFGVRIEPSLGDEKIWFERVEGWEL